MNRVELLESWLASIFEKEPYTCVPLAGDASFRRYWRVKTSSVPSRSYIVMDAPPPETTLPFIEIAGLLASQGLSVPEILAEDRNTGFLLLSDLGDELYLHALKGASIKSYDVHALYQEALRALVKIHLCKPVGLSYPLARFDMPFMYEQLEIFKTWYLETHLRSQGVSSITERLKAWLALEPLMAEVLQTIVSQPMVLIHRDYHSRNLMVLEKASPGVLDFQDAIIGPITYDVVSLFQDCYISWPIESVRQWILDFKTTLVKASLLAVHLEDEQFLKWCDWTGLQRHLKNLGVFARLHYRDGKSGYLSDIPRVLKYIADICHRYVELAPLWHFFETLVQPQTEGLEIS